MQNPRPNIPLWRWTWRRDTRVALWAAGLLMAAAGCQSGQPSPGVAAGTLGTPIADRDVAHKRQMLVGRPSDAADAVWGARRETLINPDRYGHNLRIYNVPGDLVGASSFVVESYRGSIIAVARIREHDEGLLKLGERIGIDGRFRNRTLGECLRDPSLGRPALWLRSQETGDSILVFDGRSVSQSQEMIYLVLRFDKSDRCHRVRLVGSATG
jgi:hypothetical protein